MPPKKTTGKIPKQLEAWMMVRKDVKDKNPHLSFKDVLKKAKIIYAELKKNL